MMSGRITGVGEGNNSRERGRKALNRVVREDLSLSKELTL